MKEDAKERTRKLIALGGIIKIAELDELDPAELLGLLTVAKTSFDNMDKSKKTILKKNGSKILNNRKEKKKLESVDCGTSKNIEVDDKWLL